jgi:WD repeat-containing protein 19
MDAASEYELSEDYANSCRLLIENLQKIDEAVSLVRKTKSREAAKVIVRFFQKIQDIKAVIEFLDIAGMEDDAFIYAQVSLQLILKFFDLI